MKMEEDLPRFTKYHKRAKFANKKLSDIYYYMQVKLRQYYGTLEAKLS